VLIPPLRLSTPRRPDRPTTGVQSVALAKLAGFELQPWQIHVLAVAGELIPNPDPNPAPWHPEWVHAYSNVTCSVGRRAGKSVLTFARALRTAVTGQYGFYSAQTGAAASTKFRNDWTPLFHRSPELNGEFELRHSNGSEMMRHLGSGGYCRIFSPSPQALHGEAADAIFLDEAWGHTMQRGKELEVATYPLTATRPGAQLWTLSAAGDVGSAWWHSIVERGREAAQLNTGTGTCHIEYSAHGLDDLDDPETWQIAHPAVRSEYNPTGMVTVDFLRNEYDRDPDQFRRSWLNMPDMSGEGSAPLEMETWDTLATDPVARITGSMSIGVAVAPEQAATAVVVCYMDQTQTPVIEVDTYRAGTDWVVDRVADLQARYDVSAVSMDSAGQSPAVVLARPFSHAGIGYDAATLPDVTASAAEFVDAVRNGRIRHVRNPSLDLAAGAVRRRSIGDGSWAFGRKDTTADISPIEAATHALWANPDAHNAPHAAIV
jgi:phage terminase large subunit-like protein